MSDPGLCFQTPAKSITSLMRIKSLIKLSADTRAGFAASSVVWLQMKAGLGFRHWNLWVCSVANYQSFWFLGLLNTWIPLPVNWASRLVSRWTGTASHMLKVGLLSFK